MNDEPEAPQPTLGDLLRDNRTPAKAPPSPGAGDVVGAVRSLAVLAGVDPEAAVRDLEHGGALARAVTWLLNGQSKGRGRPSQNAEAESARLLFELRHAGLKGAALDEAIRKREPYKEPATVRRQAGAYWKRRLKSAEQSGGFATLFESI